MSISYWFLLQSKYGIVPNRGTSKNFLCYFLPCSPTGNVNNKEVGCLSVIDRHRQTPK